MKKLFKRFWGVGLVIIILSSMFVATAPVTAADPLRWESKTGGPSTIFMTLTPGYNILDFASSADAKTIYAVYKRYPVATQVGTAIAGGNATDNQTLTVTYTNELGVASRSGTLIVTNGQAASTVAPAGTFYFQVGDYGMISVQNIVVASGNSTSGVINIRFANVTTGGVVMGIYNFASGFTAGNASPGYYGLLQSTSGGSSWTDITSRLISTGAFSPVSTSTVTYTSNISMDYVAMAPDDANTVVVASSQPNATYSGVAISTDAGATFGAMGFTGTATTVINGLEISPLVTGGFRYVAVYGRDGAATANGARLWYYNYGSGVGGWNDGVTGGRFINHPTAGFLDSIVGLSFSPAFASDYIAVALSEQTGGVSDNGSIFLHILSFNWPTTGTGGGWDTAVAQGYPVTVTTESAIGNVMSVTKADVVLGPDYMGGDDTTRIAYVGAQISGNNTSGGIWRVTDSTAVLKTYTTTGGINSITYDGTTVVAGAYTTNNIVYCTDPLSALPSVLNSRSMKRIGIDDVITTNTENNNDRVLVKYIGTTVYGSKRGVGGAIAKSADGGLTWNDITLMNTVLANIDDIYVSPDGATWYIASHDNTTSSVFRMSPMQRVLCVAFTPTVPDFILRGIASDANVIYAADKGGTVIYYSADGGVSRWQLRANVPAAITDLAAEGTTNVYFGSGVSVYKSPNNGFTWNSPVNTTMTSGSIGTILSLATDKLMVGGSLGSVIFSKDGGTTWTRTLGLPVGSTTAQIAATGLDTGNFIFASPTNSNKVYRCEIGSVNPAYEFKDMNIATATAGESTRGLALVGGVLYAISSTISSSATDGDPTYLNSCLTPTMNAGSTVPASAWRTRYASNYTNSAATTNSQIKLISTPSALKVSSSTTKATLWGVNNYRGYLGSAMGVYYFDDTLSLTGPALTGPADKALVQTNSVSGNPMNVNLTWSRPSLANSYDVQVALDSAFNSLISDQTTAFVAYVGADGTSATMAKVLAGASTAFNPGATYYWRIRANQPISSAWSETRSFTIQPVAAAVPGISSPVNGSTIASITPAFSWTPVTSATKYDFQLNTSPTFGTTTMVMTDTPASAGTLVPSTAKLSQGQQYFWRVRALEPILGDWSTAANFIVALPPTTSAPPVTVTNAPPVTITIPPASAVPAITLAPAAVEKIAPTYIWAIIIIGAILVIAVIVLIVRTRRSV